MTEQEFLAGITPRLRGYLRMFLPEEAEAEDVLQDVFLERLRRGSSREAGAAEAWLFARCRQRALNALRSDRHRREREEAYAAQRERPVPEPGAAAQQEELAGRLETCLRRLSWELRELLFLKVIEELPLREIEARTGRPRSTVALRLREGLLALNLCLHGSER